DHCGITAEACVLQFASASFDAAIWEVAGALASGARLMLIREHCPEALESLIRIHGVSHATLPPVVLAELAADLPNQTLVCAGEACPPDLVERWCTGRRMINAFGPTETTVCASMSEALAGGESTIPIGRPILNTRVYVLDAGMQPVPAGV